MGNEVDVDIIQNGAGSGSVVKRMLEVGFNSDALRPWQENGRTYVNAFDPALRKMVAQPLVTNDATLLKDEWKLLDTAVRKVARQRLRAVQDLRDSGLVMTLPNAMGTTVFQSQAQSDISDAEVSMDALRRTDGDRPVYDITSLPLPIISKDFSFSAREIQMSRQGNAPLDTSMAELAGRKVAEYVEKFLIGVQSTYTFGGGTIYGYLNYTNKISVTVSDWGASGITGATVLSDTLAMITASRAAKHYGPWRMYVAEDFGIALDEDFKAASDKTIRQRILEVDGIESIKTLDYQTASTVILVEMSAETVRLIDGMPVQTVQWPTEGGMRLNFKVMTIQVPQIRSDYNSNCGLVVGTT